MSLHQLLDSAIEHRRKEERILSCLWEELRKDQTKRLVIIFRIENIHKYNYHTRTGYKELTITSDSLDDFTMWDQFILYAIETLFSSQYDSRSHQVEGNSSSHFLNPDVIDGVIEFLRPLAQRTHFVGGKSDNPFTGFHYVDHNGDNLRNLFESVLAKHRNETLKLFDSCEMMKTLSENKISCSYCLFLKFEKEGRYVVSWNVDCSALIIASLTNYASMRNIPIVFMVQKHPWIQFDMKCEDFGDVLKYLKPLVQRLHFTELYMDFLDSEINTISYLMDNVPVNHILFYPECFKEDFGPWLELVKKVRPQRVTCGRTENIQESEALLFPLACLVESITIGDEVDLHMTPLPLSTIKYILEQKCNYLEINDNSTFLSGSDAEKLIQIGHHLSKKVSLNANTKSDDLEFQIGHYSTKVYEEGKKYMKIQHLDF